MLDRIESYLDNLRVQMARNYTFLKKKILVASSGLQKNAYSSNKFFENFFFRPSGVHFYFQMNSKFFWKWQKGNFKLTKDWLSLLIRSWHSPHRSRANEDEYEFSAQRAANEFFSFLVQILLKTLNYKKTKSDVKLFKFFLLNFNFTNKNARKKIP